MEFQNEGYCGELVFDNPNKKNVLKSTLALVIELISTEVPQLIAEDHSAFNPELKNLKS